MVAGGDGVGARYHRSWYLTREEIERGSPSRRDGVGAAKEAQLRATYCSFIRDVCLRLQLPRITLATAILLCHRFYLRQSLARNEWQTIATVCVFLASKIEETPCQLRRVVSVAYETMYQKSPDAAKRIHQDEVLEKQKTLILAGETLLLSTIGFDFNIQHPYEPLKLALKNIGITQKEVKEAALNLINDTLPTTLALQFEPRYIAAGSLFLAAKFHNIRLSETGEVWWQAFHDVAFEQLKVVLQQMTELFNKRNPCLMGASVNPTRVPTPGDKQQIISTSSPDIKPPPTPTLMDRQITSTEGPAPRQPQSSRRTSDSAKLASRCLHVDSLSCSKSICSSARDEQYQSLRRHTNHRLNIVAVDQRSEKPSSKGTLKADHVYHMSSSGSKDTSKTGMMELARHKRKIQDIRGYAAAGDISGRGASMERQLRSVIVIETNSSWKRQKVERR